MSISNATETPLLAFIFEATATAWAAATNLNVHLHVADPGEAGTSATLDFVLNFDAELEELLLAGAI